MSNYKNLSELIQQVIRKLSLYPGTSVQIYAEDRISDMIISLFIELFEKRFWNDNTFWYKYTLTGIDGVVAENPATDIAKISDIEYISTLDNPKFTLKRLHSSTNPYTIVGSRPAYYTTTKTEGKVFAVVPFTSTGEIFVRARTRPTIFYPDTEIPFDPDVLVSGVCYKYCCDDAASQIQIQRFKEEYDNRYLQLTKIDNDGKFDWNDEQAYYNGTDWR